MHMNQKQPKASHSFIFYFLLFCYFPLKISILQFLEKLQFLFYL